MAILPYREMDPEKRISQIGHRIDIGAEGARRFVRIEIESLERKNAIFLRKAKIESNLIGIKPSRVDNMTGAEASLRRHNHPLFWLADKERRCGS